MKIHCYFLSNIKYAASQLYLGAKYNCEAPGRALCEAVRGGGLSEAPGEGPLRGPPGGLQLSSAGDTGTADQSPPLSLHL